MIARVSIMLVMTGGLFLPGIALPAETADVPGLFPAPVTTPAPCGMQPVREGLSQSRSSYLGPGMTEILRMRGQLAGGCPEPGAGMDTVRQREEMLRGLRASLGEMHPATLQAMVALADAYAASGRDIDAVPLQEQVLRDFAGALGDAHPVARMAAERLASMYAAVGRYDDALLMRQRLLAFHAGEPAGSDALTAMTNLAHAYSALGRTEEALPLLRRVYEARMAALGERHADTLAAMGNLALAEAALGRLDEAVRLQEVVLRLRTALLGESHSDTLNAMVNLSTSYSGQGRHAEALPLETKVLAMRAAHLGDAHPDTVRIMGNLAATLDALGKPAQALALHERAYQASESQPGPGGSATAGVLASLAVSLDRNGEHRRAAALLARYVSLVEDLRARPGLTPESRRALFAAYVPVFRFYARQLLLTGQDAESFRISELSKARTLLESTARERASRSGILPPEAQARVDRLEAEALGIENALARAGNDMPLRLHLDVRRNEVQRAHADLQAELGRRYPRYAQLLDVSVLDAASGARVLPIDTLFVSFLPADAGWLAFALDRRGVLTATALDADATRDLARLVQEFRGALQNGGTSPRGVEREDARDGVAPPGRDQLADELGRILLGPLEARLKSHRHLVISPDGVLATLPFESLRLGGRELVVTHDVTYVQSLSVYALLAQRGAEYGLLRDRRPLFAMGNPVYRPVVARGGHPQFSWEPLPGTARELAAVEKLFGIVALQQAQASEHVLRKLDANGELARYRNLLFSAHGFLDLQEPGRSSLVLSQDDAIVDAANDGYISASEWPGYKLKSDLLVLSACETALGRQAQGEGIMGLPYALYVAGNKSTVLTLWSIDDAASALFIEKFFAKLKAGMSESEALNETKREFLADERYSAPKFWAPFVMYGT